MKMRTAGWAGVALGAIVNLGAPASAQDSMTGWLEADGSGETAIVWRAAPTAVDYTLSCKHHDKTLNAWVAAPADFSGQRAKAILTLGAASIEGTAIASKEGAAPMIRFKTALTADLLKTIAAARTSTLKVGSTATEAGKDPTGKAFRDFAQSCAAITGLQPPSDPASP